MPTSEKILKYHTNKNYLYRSIFDPSPERIFLCIWPASSEIKQRASIGVRKTLPSVTFSNLPKHLKKCPESAPYELFFKPFNSQSRQWLYKKDCVLKLNKTANHFDKNQFFWQGAAGHRIELKSHEVAPDGSIVFRASDPMNSNKKFLQMLAVIGENLKKPEIFLEDYIRQHFDLAQYRSYSLAIYLQVDFLEDRDHFGQPIYRLHIPPFFSEENFEISSILYEFSKPNTLKITQDTFSVSEEFLFTSSVDNEQQNAEIKLDLQHIIKKVLLQFEQKNQSHHYEAIAQAIAQEILELYGKQ